jgi:hypothetical protein
MKELTIDRRTRKFRGLEHSHEGDIGSGIVLSCTFVTQRMSCTFCGVLIC